MGARPEHGEVDRPGSRERPPQRELPLRFPDFLGIGAQKAGTTWLYRNLRGHPDVWLPPVKELHYFDQLCVDTPGHQQAAGERRRRRAEHALGKLAEHGSGGNRSADLRAASLIATGTVSDEWYGSILAVAHGEVELRRDHRVVCSAPRRGGRPSRLAQARREKSCF